ncbi:MAG: OmpA family protein [Planctomycetota bacterium]
MLNRLFVVLPVLLCLVAFAGCQHFQPREEPQSTVASWETPSQEPAIGPSEKEMEAMSEKHQSLKKQLAEMRGRVDSFTGEGEPVAPASGATTEPEITGGCPACIDRERLTNALRGAGLTDLEVSTTSEGETCIILSGKVSFGAGRADLMKGAKDRLSKLNPVLRDICPDVRLRLDGHTDSDPIRKSKWSGNHELSQARAAAVAEQFVTALGWSRSKVSTRGFGEEIPIASNATREGKARNRRVEIVLVH